MPRARKRWRGSGNRVCPSVWVCALGHGLGTGTGQGSSLSRAQTSTNEDPRFRGPTREALAFSLRSAERCGAQGVTGRAELSSPRCLFLPAVRCRLPPVGCLEVGRLGVGSLGRAGSFASSSNLWLRTSLWTTRSHSPGRATPRPQRTGCTALPPP